MVDLETVLCEEVRKYAANGTGINLRLLPVLDAERQTFAVIAIDHPLRKAMAGVVVLARIAAGHIIIEEDTTDKPLVDALLQRGVPRERIVLAYAGEPLPETEQSA
jgi:hypothetical protein